MVVDDDAEIRETLEMLLESSGYLTVTASDGVEAQRLLQHDVLPSLILLDLRMPRMNGLEFLAWLRASAVRPRIPVVLFTGDTAGAQLGETAGCDATLVKPVDIDDVLGVVARYARGGGQGQGPGQRQG
jgi:CheY-like chemotaxis protein